MLKCLILAGGKGSRLWPLSRGHYPKQFLKLGGEDSLLQKTLRRALHLVPVQELYLVTHKDHVHDVLAQSVAVDPGLRDQILEEPMPKNTGPAIAFSVQSFIEAGADPSTLVLVCPADHLISPDTTFVEQVRNSLEWARQGYIVTFGITPTRPDTGYGYIQVHEDKVVRFIEKPSAEVAQQLIEEKNYYWNAGIFLFSLETFLHEWSRYGLSMDEPQSIDYALMEKTDRLVCRPLSLHWSDIGSWEAVYEFLDKDSSKNVVQGSAELIRTERSLVIAKKRLVAALGIQDMVIIETEDSVLVMPRSEAQHVKEVVAALQSLSVVDEPQTMERPWGQYTILESGERFKIKKITVHPQQKLSLQMHMHRSEHWVVVRGTAEVTIQDRKQIVHEGQSIFVPKSAMHRVANPGKIDLEIIEVQVGEYLGEDDILRIEDIYGRLDTEASFQLLVDAKNSAQQ